MGSNKSSVIPNFLRADSLEQLRIQMYLTNVRLASGVQYFDIQKDGGQWIAFYYEELQQSVVTKLLNGQTKKAK